MIVKEFLTECMAPLQSHSRPLWDYQGSNDNLRLQSARITPEELNRVVKILLNGDLGDLPEAYAPQYCCDDRADLVAKMPVFDELWLPPAEGLGSPMMVSSGDTMGGEDSEKTTDDDLAGASPPS